MKEKLVCLLMLLCSINLFTACSSDDEPAYPIDQEIAGTYKGALNIELGGNNIGKDLPKNVSLTKATDNKINLELKNFSFGATSLGNIVLSNCEVKKNGNTYMFTSSQTLTTLPPAIGNCPITVNGTVTDGKLNVKLVITVSKLGQVVNVVYDGVRLKGNESSEAKIKSFTFDSPIVTEQPVIDEANGTITFKVSEKATDDELKLTPAITVSDKATITPAASVKQDFSGTNSVVYTVVAEDGTIKEYRVSVAGRNSVVAYNFEDWKYDTSLYGEEDKIHMATGWASCNNAVALIKKMGSFAGITYEGEYPLRPITDHVSGNFAALLESVDTKGGSLMGQKIPKVTAGTIFLGAFDAFAGLADPMNTTKFGISYDKKPLTVKGFFKYTPGDQYFDANGQLVAAKKDTCSISAVLYEVQNDSETLNGSTIYTSDKVVATAMFTNARADQFTPFQLNMVYRKEFNPTKKYKFTIIFSSSKDGASYNAAVGSRLIVDDVMVINQ